MLPAFPGYSQGLRRAGPYGGYLGPKFDPVFSTADAHSGKDTSTDKDFYNPNVAIDGEPRLPRLDGGLTLDALDRRRTLVDQLDAHVTAIEGRGHNGRRDAAFDLLLSPKAKSAFDLSREPLKLRDRYGRDLFGSSVLLARRLVEAGVTFVTVHTEAKPNGHWDTHENNFNMLKGLLLPFLDRSVSALLDDLADRGLLESTLVVVTGDMGRTPQGERQGRSRSLAAVRLLPLRRRRDESRCGPRHDRQDRRLPQRSSRLGRRPGRDCLSPGRRGSGGHRARSHRPATIISPTAGRRLPACSKVTESSCSRSVIRRGWADAISSEWAASRSVGYRFLRSSPPWRGPTRTGPLPTSRSSSCSCTAGRASSRRSTRR